MAEPKDERIVTRRNTNSSPSASNNNGVGISKLTNVKEEPSVSCSNSNGSDPEAGDSYDVQASLVPVEKRHHLGYYSTSALIINKIIGTGIFVSPRIVLAAAGSKGISLVFWSIGCVVTWAGLFIYLEYGIRWPVTGGELYYVDYVYRKPYRLFTYMFATLFVLFGGVHVNAMTFAREVILAGSPVGAAVDPTLQKFFAIVIVTFICQLQAFSRYINVYFSNALALFKVLLLGFISVAGWVALAGKRTPSAASIRSSYGKGSLANLFVGDSGSPYGYSLALLNIMRAFLGYENANFVLEEVRASSAKDERKVFRRAVKISVFTVCFLYLMTNIAFFTACSTDEILSSSETLALFLEKVFGPSSQAYKVSAVVISLSAVGNIMAITFANVRVKQEIARLGLLPIPEFWSKTSHRRTPAPALLLHWIFSVACIVATPLDSPDGFLVMSTFYSYTHTWISIIIGIGLLCAHWLKCFDHNENRPWRPASSSLGYWLLVPLTVIYISANAFVIVLSWFPANLQQTLSIKTYSLPSFAGPLAGHSVLFLGALFWAWDQHALPWLGYHFWTTEDTVFAHNLKVDVLHVGFHRRCNGFAERVCYFWRPVFGRCKEIFLEKETDDPPVVTAQTEDQRVFMVETKDS